MKIVCKICCGTGKVDKDFGLGNCKTIPGDIIHRVCPGCDGTGMQEEDSKIEIREIVRYKKPRCPDIKPFDHPFDNPWPSPFDPYKPRRRKWRGLTPMWCYK